MFFRQLKVGMMQNFVYIIGDETSKEAVVVDAGWDINKIINDADKENLKIKKIILTHSHYDHIQKADELASKTDAEVFFHEDDSNEVKKFWIKKIASQRSNFFSKDNDETTIGKLKIKVIHTPGHTPGSICLLAENKLLTGDTLFVNAIGRTDLAGGDSVKLFESLQKLKKLNDDVEVYPGHDYGEIPFSTIGNEKKNNPYFKCESKEQFLNLIL